MASLAHPPLAFDASGTPFSTLFNDVYRTRSGAIDESRSVFVEGCRLAECWQSRPRVTVLEVGFGLGLNLLASVEALLAHGDPVARLNFVSVEAHPLSRDDLLAAHRACGVDDSPLLRALRERWPMALPGLHRIVLAGGRVQLLLAFGDAARMLPKLKLRADAIYLDGFAPTRNPSAWEARVLRQVARLAAPGARLATYSAASAVREGLAEAGFEVTRVPGFGGKRDRIDATYAPRWKTWTPAPAAPAWVERRAVVVGAGIAGAAVASRLCAEGWRITLIDRLPGPGGAGSNQPLIADHLHLSPDDNVLARLTRAAMLLRDPADAGGAPAGRLTLATDDDAATLQQSLLDRLRFPEGFARWLDADAAADHAGCKLPRGGIWVPGSTIANPSIRIAEQIKSAGAALTWIGAADVAQLDRLPDGDGWSVTSRDGRVLAQAPVVVLCDAGGGGLGPPIRSLALRRVRGQTSWLSHPRLAGLRTVLGGAAYMVPSAGRTLIGSTYDDLDSCLPDAEADRSNARRAASMLAAESDSFGPHVSSASLGFRWTAPDRLPLIGLMPDEAEAERSRADLLRNERLPLPHHRGLYCVRGFGSRGLLWSTLAAELVVCWLEGGPVPLEAELVKAIDPARALRMMLRRRGGGVSSGIAC